MAQVSNLESECETTSQRLEREHFAVVNKLNDEIAALKQESSAKCDDMTKQLVEKTGEITALRRQLDSAEKELLEATEEHNAMVEGLLKAQIDSTDKELTKERETYASQINEGKVEVELLQQKLCAVHEELDEANETAKTLQENLAEKAESFLAHEQKYSNKIDELMDQVSAKDKELSLHKDATLLQSEEVESLRAKLSNDETSFNDTVRGVQEQLESVKSELVAEKESFSNYKEETALEQQKLQQELESNIKLMENKDLIIESMKGEVESCKTDLSVEREKVAAAGDNTSAIIESLHQEAESLQNELTSVKANAEATIALKTSEADDAVTRIAEMKEVHNNALSALAAEQRVLRGQVEIAENRVSALEATLTLEREANQDKMSSTEASLVTLQMDLATERESFTKLKQSSKSKIDGLQVLVSSLESDLKTEKDSCVGKEHSFKSQVDALQQQVTTLEAELITERESFSQSSMTSSRRVTELEDQLSALRVQLDAEQAQSSKLTKEINNIQFAEKNVGDAIQSLKDELDKKNKQLDQMKKKDFDTLRKQNENISHLQREYDDFSQSANEKIQSLTAEVLRYKQLESAGALETHHVNNDVLNMDEVNAKVVDAIVKCDVGKIRDERSDEAVDDTNEEDFKFKEKEPMKEQVVVVNPLEVDLAAKVSVIASLEEEVQQLKTAMTSIKDSHATELEKFQSMLSKKDMYISSIKDEQYRQEREIAQLEEVVFEKKQTRQKRAGNSRSDGRDDDVEEGAFMDDESDSAGRNGSASTGRLVLCGDKSSWGSGTPTVCLSLWSCVRSMCPQLLRVMGDRPPTLRACIIIYGVVIHALVWYLFAKSNAGCVSMPSLRGSSSP